MFCLFVCLFVSGTWRQYISELPWPIAVKLNRLRKVAGRPRHGPIFDNRQSHRMVYRKRLREEQRNETQAYTNELHEALMLKNGSAFWKCWRSKFNISTRKARRLSLFGHIARMPDESDDKQILSAPPGELEETIRTSP